MFVRSTIGPVIFGDSYFKTFRRNIDRNNIFLSFTRTLYLLRSLASSRYVTTHITYVIICTTANNMPCNLLHTCIRDRVAEYFFGFHVSIAKERQINRISTANGAPRDRILWILSLKAALKLNTFPSSVFRILSLSPRSSPGRSRRPMRGGSASGHVDKRRRHLNISLYTRDREQQEREKARRWTRGKTRTDVTERKRSEDISAGCERGVKGTTEKRTDILVYMRRPAEENKPDGIPCGDIVFERDIFKSERKESREDASRLEICMSFRADNTRISGSKRDRKNNWRREILYMALLRDAAHGIAVNITCVCAFREERAANNCTYVNAIKTREVEGTSERHVG